MTDSPIMGASVRRLEQSEVDVAAELLTRAFFDYPVWTWVMPDPAVRAELLPQSALVTVRWGLLMGETYVTGEPMSGIAVWMPHGTGDVDPDGSLTGWAAWERNAGKEISGKLEAMNQAQGEVRRKECPGPHWYLAWLGVEPTSQRGGHGGALLRHTLKRLGNAGLPALLETEKEANVAYYERHGFRIAHAGMVPGGGPPFWTMVWRP